MRSILETCQPRNDLRTGAFNPEIFTAVLSQVLEYYRGNTNITQNIYTDAETFFTEATHPTQGMKSVLSDVFGRLAGENSLPAIHRLETAFGGGKTHTLIACTHLGFRGRELAKITSEILDPVLLPAPGEVVVVGVAGDEVPVHRPKGKALIPYTLWGEMAFQIGGKTLYSEVEEEVTSHAAPGRTYFERVLGGRKVLIMLDELAQYATRLEAAREHGAEQLAAFLMGLHGYARSHAGIAVVLTLASQKDAFATQTRLLTELLAQVRGADVAEDEVVALREKAEQDLQSVVARDASPVTPVQASEISRVLAKRLFTSIDASAARETAKAFTEMYARNAALLPDEATRADFEERLVAHYPFHPTLIDFLNNKLATVETFHGTRGVLRVLAVTVRNIWRDDLAIPMVHTCHLNLRDARIVGEVLGRTGSSDLLPVLNADIGGVDTEHLEGGRSNAELADLHNPHPQGYPMHEWGWRVVFLHSLVGRDEGLQSELFGLTAQQALFEVSFPGLTPPQVQTALAEITESAFYLRMNEGRYYASLDPSVNVALARLRRTLASSDRVTSLLDATARKIVRADSQNFHVVPDVSAPEHVPDKKDRPVLALVTLGASTIDVDAFVTTVGPNRPRHQQNTVFLLVPDTVAVKAFAGQEDTLFSTQQTRTQEAYKKLQDVARWVVAMRLLREKPQDYGINKARLEEQEFDIRHAEREQALITAVTQAYSSLWFPSASGHLRRVEIKTAGGEGGESIIELIRKELLEAGELVTAEHTGQSDLVGLSQLFFAQGDTVTLAKLRENFCALRHWPVLEAPSVFEQIVRAGVTKGSWCLFRMGSDENTKPEELYGRDAGDVPYNLDLSRPDFMLVTLQGANQRGWTTTDKVDPIRVKEWVKDAVSQYSVATVERLAEQLAAQHGTIPQHNLMDAVVGLVQEGRLLSFSGRPDQQDAPPELLTGSNAMLYTPRLNDVVITKAEAAQRGWLAKQEQVFRLIGKDGAHKLVPLLARIGSLYARGAQSSIDLLDLIDLALPGGGTLRLSLNNVPPESMKRLGELFEVLAGIIQVGEATEGYLDISNPSETCLLIRELHK